MLPNEVGTRLFFSRPQREGQDTVKSAVISTFLHILIVIALLLLSRAGLHLLNADQGVGTGIGAGPAGGGGGGGRDEEISLLIPAPPPPAAEVPPLVAPQTLEEIKIPEPIKQPEIALAKVDSLPIAAPAPAPSTSGTGIGTGAGQGQGTGPGTGPGSGGGSGGGEGGGIGSGVGPGTGRGRAMPPAPDVLFIPPPAPGGLRGKAVTVRLTVDTAGAVKNAELIPPTGDRKYDGALKSRLLGWHFRPARDALNRAITMTFDVVVTL